MAAPVTLHHKFEAEAPRPVPPAEAPGDR